MKVRAMHACLGTAAAILVFGLFGSPALGAASDPLFVFTPKSGQTLPPEEPPPSGYFIGPCGLAFDVTGDRFYVSDYYHHAVDVYSTAYNYGLKPNDGSVGYQSQIPISDPLDGPCGLAIDASNRLYVNTYHRSVIGPAGTLTGAGVDATHPTGVAVDTATGNVYVDAGTYVAAYDSAGNPIMNGASPLQIGLNPLADYYGVAFAGGRVYVADATSGKVRVFNSDPALDVTTPLATMSGPPGGFTSLLDSAIAISPTTGELYVADDLQPALTEEPQATIDVFGPTPSYSYEGHLKYNIVDARPPGLAAGPKGGVYVTSGTTYEASIYAYPSGSATTAPPLPPTFTLSLAAAGSGRGQVTASRGELDCSTACSAPVRSGASVELTATPDSGSAFAGWSGGGCSGTGACTVTMAEATSVSTNFKALTPAPEPVQASAEAAATSPTRTGERRTGTSRHRHHHRHRHRHRRIHSRTPGGRR